MSAPKQWWLYVLLWAVLPPLALGYQAAAETMAHALHTIPFGGAWLMHAATLPALVWLISIEIVGLGAWMAVLNFMPLAQAFPATAVSYVLILGLSALVLHERINALAACGALIIFTGVWLVSRSDAVVS